jgi:16S rRNA A1518/A1519 N6-dimethyltransferase RsmA/KsgA/DIM1 with predicted DNA glycosylase/AP lyase activity
LIDEDERLEAFNLSKIAFQQKRKKIKSALQEYFSVDELEKLGINPDDRPQKLTPEQYLLLAKSLK